MTTAAEEAISLSKPSTSPNDGDEQANRETLTSTSSSCTPPPTPIQQQQHLINQNNVLVMTHHEPAVAAADPAILAILPAPPSAGAAAANVALGYNNDHDDDEGELATAAPTVKYRYPLEFLLKLKDAPLAQEKPTALLANLGSGNSATSSGTPLSCFIDSPGGQQTSAGESSRWSNCRGGDRGNQNNDQRGDRDRDSGRSRGDRDGGGIGSGAMITRGGGGDRSGGLGGLAGQDIRLEPDGYRRRPGDPQRRSFNTGCFVPLTTSSRRTHSPTPPGGSGSSGNTSVTSGGKLTNEQSDRTIGGGEREREGGGRRIGSGRILPYLEKGGGGVERDDALEGGGGYGDGGRGSYGGRGGRRDMGGDRVDVVADRYDRRSVFTRNTNNNSSLDYDNANSSQDNTQRNSSNSNNNHPSANNNNKSQQSRTIISNRYEQQHSGGYQPRSGNNRRMIDQREIEEPEWFSSGPISQHDTIELRGFDDSDKTPKKLRHPAHAQKKKTIVTTSNNSNNSVVNNQRNNSTGKENENSSSNTKEIEADKCSSDKPAQRGSPNLHKGCESIDDKKSLIGQGDNLDKVPSSSNLVQNDDLNNSFNLDEILKLDIPDVLANGVESVGGSAASSRFSRWFQQNKSPPPPRVDSPQLQHQQTHQVADDYLRSLIGDDQHQSHDGLLSGLNQQQSFAAAATIQQHHFQQPNQQTHQQHPLHISAPGDSASYFAPISPASTQPGFPYQQQQQNYQQHQMHNQPHQHYQQQQAGTNMLADMLQGRSGANNRTTTDSTGNDIRRGVLGMATPPGSKVFSLEELEGNIKGTAAMMMSQQQQQQKHAMLHRAQHQHVAPSQPILTPNQQQPNKGVEDVDAFKRMLEQAGHGLTNGPSNINTLNPQPQQSKSNTANNANNKPPPTLMEMLAQSQPQSHTHSAHQPELSQFTSNQSHYASKQQQMEYHLKQQQQQQQQLLNSMIYNNQQQQQTSGRISPDMRSVCREIVQRPETQALLQGLKRGDISPAHIYQQLSAPSLQPRQREALQIALKQHVASTASNAAATLPTQQHQPPVALPVVGSPGGGTSPQPQWSQQLRLSPLPPQGVNPLHKRIPSPYELQVHTQNIMQRALIKKKLEEQQENYRKKQEAAASSGTGSGRDLSPSTSSIATSTTSTILPTAVSTALSVGQQQSSTITSQIQQQQQMQHHKAAASPTPTIAFTPTSVLRKMTADKDDAAAMTAMINATTAKIQQQQQHQQQQGRAVIGNMRAQQAQPGSITSQWGLFQQASKPVGRPIVKSTQNDPTGSYTSQQQQASLISNQQHQEQLFQQRMLHHQQQQQQKWNQYYSQQQQQQNQHQQLFGSAGQHQLTPQQLRAQQQNIRAQHQHQQGSGNQRVQQGWAAMFADQQTTNSQNQVGRSIGRDTNNSNSSVGGCAGGDLSPTSNQLAKWFSPDLLERARNGKCPVLPNPALAKRALNVEDVEQQRRRRGSGNVLNPSAAAGDN